MIRIKEAIKGFKLESSLEIKKLQDQIKTLEAQLDESFKQRDAISQELVKISKTNQLEVNSEDTFEGIRAGGSAIFRSKKDDFSPQDWLLKDEIKISNSSVVVYVKQPIKHFIADTNSMLPTLDKDSHIIILPQEHWPKDKLPKVGDIIVYQKKGSINSICHRVVRVRTNKIGLPEYQCQGDNCKGADATWVALEEIKGVVVLIAY